MRLILKIALGAAVAACLGNAVTTPALASPAFVRCEKGVEGEAPTKYTSNQCTSAASSLKGSWEPEEDGGLETIRLVSFSLRLTDKEAGLLKENSAVKCNGNGSKGSGAIANPYVVEVRVAEIESASTNCERLSGPCEAGKIEKVAGADLPWKVEMFETEGKFLSKILPDGNGEPGWAVTCKTSLGSKTDTCISESTEKAEQGELLNDESAGVALVTERFESAHKAKCSEAEGKKETGEVAGKVAILRSSGEGLRVEKVDNPFYFTTNHLGEYTTAGEKGTITVHPNWFVTENINKVVQVVGSGRRVAFEVENEDCNGATIEWKLVGANKTCSFELKFTKPSEPPEAAGKINRYAVHPESLPLTTFQAATVLGKW